jgi:DDE superfamily endonuclease
MLTDDLELEDRAVDIIGLYLHPLQHAAVFCAHEGTRVQIPDQSDEVVFESWLQGTLSLSAAIDIGIGEAPGNAISLHTSAEFDAFLTDVVVNQPHGKEIFVVADDVSAHSPVRVNESLQTHRTVHLQTCTSYSSWLNQIEQWLSKIGSDIDGSPVPISGTDLKKKLMRHIRHYKKVSKAVKWKYFDPATRLTTDSDSTVH